MLLFEHLNECALANMEAKELIATLRGLGLSQREIGEECGLSQGAIGHVVTGRSKDVYAGTQRQLEALLARELKARGREVPRS